MNIVEATDITKTYHQGKVEVHALRDVSLTAESAEQNAVKLSGKVAEKYRTHTPTLVLDADERMRLASCSCNFYSQNRLRKGPCEHILALRIAHGRRMKTFERLSASIL